MAELKEPQLIQKLTEENLNTSDIFIIDKCKIFESAFGPGFGLLITNTRSDNSYSLILNYSEKISDKSKFGSFYKYIKSVDPEAWIGFKFRFINWKLRNREIQPIKS